MLRLAFSKILKMKAINWYAIALTVSLYACGGTTSENNNMSSTKEGININPEMLTQVEDPICGMNMTQSKIADTLTYNGKLYAFCNTGCKEEFKANPEKYLK